MRVATARRWPRRASNAADKSWWPARWCRRSSRRCRGPSRGRRRSSRRCRPSSLPSCAATRHHHDAPGRARSHGKDTIVNTALWIIAGVLAITYVGCGAAQILVPKDRYRGLRGSSQHWADDFQPGHLTAIGTLKIIGAIGLVLPPLAGLPPVLSPLA